MKPKMYKIVVLAVAVGLSSPFIFRFFQVKKQDPIVEEIVQDKITVPQVEKTVFPEIPKLKPTEYLTVKGKATSGLDGKTVTQETIARTLKTIFNKEELDESTPIFDGIYTAGEGEYIITPEFTGVMIKVNPDYPTPYDLEPREYEIDSYTVEEIKQDWVDKVALHLKGEEGESSKKRLEASKKQVTEHKEKLTKFKEEQVKEDSKRGYYLLVPTKERTVRERIAKITRQIQENKANANNLGTAPIAPTLASRIDLGACYTVMVAQNDQISFLMPLKPVKEIGMKMTSDNENIPNSVTPNLFGSNNPIGKTKPKDSEIVKPEVKKDVVGSPPEPTDTTTEFSSVKMAMLGVDKKFYKEAKVGEFLQDFKMKIVDSDGSNIALAKMIDFKGKVTEDTVFITFIKGSIGRTAKNKVVTSQGWSVQVTKKDEKAIHLIVRTPNLRFF